MGSKTLVGQLKLQTVDLLGGEVGGAEARGDKLSAVPCIRQEEHRLNADAASQHLAGILSASQTQATYLK